MSEHKEKEDKWRLFLEHFDQVCQADTTWDTVIETIVNKTKWSAKDIFDVLSSAEALVPNPEKPIDFIVHDVTPWNAGDLDLLKNLVSCYGVKTGQIQYYVQECDQMEKLFDLAIWDLCLKRFWIAFNLLDHVGAKLGVDHGVFWHQAMRAVPLDSFEKTIHKLDSVDEKNQKIAKKKIFSGTQMNIDIQHKDGRSEGTIKCVSCEKLIGHFEIRHQCLESGPYPVDQCHSCFLKKPYSDLMSEDSMHRFHIRNSIPGPTSAVSLCNALQLFKSRPFLGKKSLTPHPHFEWITYEKVSDMAFKIAHSIRDVHKIPRRSFIGICGPNDEYWVAVDFGCALAGVVSVGLHQNFSVEHLAEVMINSNINTVFISKHNVSKFLEASAVPGVKLDRIFIWNSNANADNKVLESERVIDLESQVFSHVLLDSVRDKLIARWEDKPNENEEEEKKLQITRKKCEACGNNWVGRYTAKYCNPCFTSTALDHIEEVRSIKRELQEKRDKKREEIQKRIAETCPSMPQDIFTLLYTSGTTGKYKGVITTDEMWNGDMCAPNPITPLVNASYIPLSHSSDRFGRACWILPVWF
jgi:hypothetical protein